MWMLLYNIGKDFGNLGVTIALGGTNLWFIYKIMSNHLAHLAKDLKEVMEKVDAVQKEISPLKERISKIEGILQ
jgi:hypothetical protein